MFIDERQKEKISPTAVAPVNTAQNPAYGVVDPNAAAYTPAPTLEQNQTQYFVPEQSIETVVDATLADPTLAAITTENYAVVKKDKKLVIILSVVLVLVAMYAAYDFYNDLSAKNEASSQTSDKKSDDSNKSAATDSTDKTTDTTTDTTTDSSADTTAPTGPNDLSAEEQKEIAEQSTRIYDKYKDDIFMQMIEDLHNTTAPQEEKAAAYNTLIEAYRNYNTQQISSNDADKVIKDLQNKYPDIFVSTVKD
jgi:hypothetical protein